MPPVSARNIPNKITCVCWWHHRGRSLSRSSFVLLTPSACPDPTKTWRPYLSLSWPELCPLFWRLLKFPLMTREQKSTSDARCYSFSDISRCVDDSFYQLCAINISSIYMVHECLLWQVSLFDWHFKWIQHHLLISLSLHHLACNSSKFLGDLCFSECLQARI